MNKSKMEKLISCNLKYYMEKQEVTFKQLSEKTGISIPTLERYVRGDIIPNLERCIDISECIKIKIEQIWIIHRH